LRGAASIHCSKKPRAKNTENEEMDSLRDDCHLKETCKDSEVDDRLRRLTVVRGTQSGDE
jgi:hypothetical protein